MDTSKVTTISFWSKLTDRFESRVPKVGNPEDTMAVAQNLTALFGVLSALGGNTELADKNLERAMPDKGKRFRKKVILALTPGVEEGPHKQPKNLSKANKALAKAGFKVTRITEEDYNKVTADPANVWKDVPTFMTYVFTSNKGVFTGRDLGLLVACTGNKLNLIRSQLIGAGAELKIDPADVAG